LQRPVFLAEFAKCGANRLSAFLPQQVLVQLGMVNSVDSGRRMGVDQFDAASRGQHPDRLVSCAGDDPPR
jgi:hypothetical protein